MSRKKRKKTLNNFLENCNEDYDLAKLIFSADMQALSLSNAVSGINYIFTDMKSGC